MTISMYTVVYTLESQPTVFVLFYLTLSYVEIDFPWFSHSGRRSLCRSVSFADNLLPLVLYHDDLLFTDDKLEPFILRFPSPRRTEAVLLDASYLGKSSHSACLLRPFRGHLSPLRLESLSGPFACKTGFTCLLQTIDSFASSWSNESGHSRAICWNTIFDILWRAFLPPFLRIWQCFRVGSIPHDVHIH